MKTDRRLSGVARALVQAAGLPAREATRRGPVVVLVWAALAGLAGSVMAADVTWTNGGGDFLWNNSSSNWSTGTWDNANGDGAIFDPNGVATINIAGTVNASSVNFTASDYVIDGAGTLNLVSGTSTLGVGVVSVDEFYTATINAPITSAVGFRKSGAGELVLTGPLNVTGAIPLTSLISADFVIGTPGNPGANGGTVKLGTAGILPSTTRAAIAKGFLNIGANNQTFAQLTFTNNAGLVNIPWTANGMNGIYGTGTVKVDGEINVFGQNLGGGNLGNSVVTPFDLGNKTQIIRVGRGGSIPFPNFTGLMFTENVSNGSVFVTMGVVGNGTFGGAAGIGLLGNNTYTGASIFNLGGSSMTGTNATTDVTTSGIGGSLTLHGAGGSILSATTVKVNSGATLFIDNALVVGASGNNQPNIPAAQNNNRLRDDVVMTLRDGSFTYRGLASTAASETWGGIAHTGGNSVFTLIPGATGGSVDLTVSGDLTVAGRASMTVVSTGTGNTLGGNAKLFVNGLKPATDSTGIFNNVVSTTDFLTYNATTGFTPFAAYATDLATPGTNAVIGTATAITADTTINAIKRSATSTMTISAGQTLTVSSGMMLTASGTATTTGGTLAVGNVPLRTWGTNTISSAVTGTAGVIVASGTTTLSGDLSGLTGDIDINSGTLVLTSTTFTGDINVRNATLNLNASQTGSSVGTITLGVSENEVDQVGLVPTLNFSGAGANAVFNNDIIVDNGSRTAAGVALSRDLVAKFTPLGNLTGSQTFNGDLTLNSEVNLQGGGATGTSTGSTNFNGAVSGVGQFLIPNGRVVFGATSTISNDGGFLISNPGFTAQISFLGIGSGNGPIIVAGGNNTRFSYVNGSLPGGLITVQNAVGTIAPTFFPLDNSTLNNAFSLVGDTKVDVASGVTAIWAGPVGGNSILTKLGTGSLLLTNDSYTKSGGLDVQAGTLGVRTVRPGNGNVNVAAGATLRISPGAAAGTVGTSKFNDTDTILSIAGGATPTATLDIGKQAVIFDYTTTSPLTTIKSQILSGRATGTWTGLGITSSAAAADAQFGIGYGEASEFSGLAGVLAGVSFDGTAVLIRATRLGDTNLDGTVNFNDLLALAQNYNGTGKSWSQGDFDYDDSVDFNDLLSLAQNYNLSLSLSEQSALGADFSADFALALSLVPEPTSLTTLGLGTLMLRRRRNA
jgi:hypothetical protein